MGSRMRSQLALKKHYVNDLSCGFQWALIWWYDLVLPHPHPYSQRASVSRFPSAEGKREERMQTHMYAHAGWSCCSRKLRVNIKQYSLPPLLTCIENTRTFSKRKKKHTSVIHAMSQNQSNFDINVIKHEKWKRTGERTCLSFTVLNCCFNSFFHCCLRCISQLLLTS